MGRQKVNGTKLRRALINFGSLEKALEGLRQEKAPLEKSHSQLKEEIAQLKTTRDELLLQVNESNRKLNDLKNEVYSLATNVNEHKRQYQLFEGFLTMMATSPLVTVAIDSATMALQQLRDFRLVCLWQN
jgi:chromosome segregation ATPase